MEDEDRGTLLGGTATVVAVVFLLGVAGGITSATAVGCSSSADCRPVGAATAALESAVSSVTLPGTTGIVGAPPERRGNSGDGARGASRDGSPRNGGNGGGANGKSGEASGRDDGANGNSGRGDGANGKPSDAPGRGGRTNGKSAEAPGRGTGTADGNDTAEASARGRPPAVPAAVNRSSRGADRNGTVVNASVRGVRANERARIGLETRRNASENRSNASDIALSAMELTPTRNGSFTMNVTVADRIDGSPEFASDDGTEAMSHIRVNHSITNAELNGTVDVDFRVSKDRLATEGVAPEDVALYRYENGSWTELPTTVVNESDAAVRFRAESPGLSEFAAGAKRARFTVETVDVAVGEIRSGGHLRVNVRIANDGGADGEFDAQLLLDGSVVEERSLTIAAGGQRQTLFAHRVNDTGEYEVRVNDVVAGTVVVRESVGVSSTATERPAGESPTDAETADPTASRTAAANDASATVSGTEVPTPLFRPTALVFVVVAALLARVRRRP